MWNEYLSTAYSIQWAKVQNEDPTIDLDADIWFKDELNIVRGFYFPTLDASSTGSQVLEVKLPELKACKPGRLNFEEYTECTWQQFGIDFILFNFTSVDILSLHKHQFTSTELIDGVYALRGLNGALLSILRHGLENTPIRISKSCHIKLVDYKQEERRLLWRYLRASYIYGDKLPLVYYDKEIELAHILLTKKIPPELREDIKYRIEDWVEYRSNGGVDRYDSIS